MLSFNLTIARLAYFLLLFIKQHTGPYLDCLADSK